MFWTTDYLTIVLKINKDVIAAAFIATSVTAPAAGIIVGGLIVEKRGGYESKHSLLITTIFGLCACLMAIPIPLFDGIVGFAIFLWLFLFFGGAVVPNLVGIIISSVPKELRGSANSVNCLLVNLIGYLPAPFVYGIIYDATHKNKTAYLVTTYYSYASFFLMVIGTIIRNKKYNQRIEEETKKKETAKDETSFSPMHKERKNVELSHIQLEVYLSLYLPFLGQF